MIGIDRKSAIVIAIIAVGLLGLYFLINGRSQTKRTQLNWQIPGALSGAAAPTFTRAVKPRPFSFPRDHGPHDEYQSEWWYFTGNLVDDQQKPYGYELTFFRFALDNNPTPAGSNWRTNQMYMAHFALTDVSNNKFHAHERFSRQAIGLAGAETKRFHVWLHDWNASSLNSSGGFPLKIHAAQNSLAIDLTLKSLKPLTFHGDRGLSQKSDQPGNASYYYSATRLETTGTISIDEKTRPVAGLSWMDREWSTSALSKDQIGWDWFSLQLDNEMELMLFQLRKKDGGIDPHSAGTLILKNGKTLQLTRDQIVINVVDHWQSAYDGSRYPAQWQISIPEHAIVLTVQPLINDQELNLTYRYWEGAAQITGSHLDNPIQGRGYVELTGYANSQAP